MKVKTSLTLSEDVLAALDRLVREGESRSALIDRILREFIDGVAQSRREAREVAALNRRAAQLSAEMRDALSFQAGAADE